MKKLSIYIASLRSKLAALFSTFSEKEKLQLVDNLSQSHLVADQPWKRQELLKQFVDLEISRRPFPGFIVHYDFYKSEVYFKNHYHFIANRIFPFIEQLAFQYGFRWKGGLSGDGAFLCLSSQLDPQLQLNFWQSLVRVTTFAHDIFSIFHSLSYDQMIFDQQLDLDQEFLNQLKQIGQNNQAEYFLLRIGISYGYLGIGNHLAALYPTHEQTAHPLLEASRITGFSWGIYLADNQQLQQKLASHQIHWNQVLNILNNQRNLCLIKTEKISSKRTMYSGYRLFHPQSVETSQVQKINTLIDLITTWSEHNHFEGNYGAFDSQGASQSVSLSEFINRFQTWQMQLNLLSHCKQTDNHYQRQETMIKLVEEMTRNVVENLEKQNLEYGYIMISPHNLSIDVNNLSSLDFHHLHPRTFADIGELPPYFQPLPMRHYLHAIDTTLQQACPEGNYQLVISLRRDQVEQWYLTHPHTDKTQAFVAELIHLRDSGLIAGVDICGDEAALSMSDMRGFLQILNNHQLIHSIHAGETPPELVYQGLDNIVTAVNSGAVRLGQGFAYLYLLAADAAHQTVLSANQIQMLLKKISQPFSPDEINQQGYFIERLNQFLQQKQVVIQANLVSNLYTVHTLAPDQNQINNKSFLKRFKYHPLVFFLLKRGVEAITELPKIILSTDDYVATGYNLEQELQTLVSLLLEEGLALEEIKYLLYQLLPVEWEE